MELDHGAIEIKHQRTNYLVQILRFTGTTIQKMSVHRLLPEMNKWDILTELEELGFIEITTKQPEEYFREYSLVKLTPRGLDHIKAIINDGIKLRGYNE